jgi:pimeloyl-ACP methyl ester carboxylesterase
MFNSKILAATCALLCGSQALALSVPETIQAKLDQTLFEQNCPYPIDGYHCYAFNTPEDYEKPQGTQAKMVFGFRPADGEAQGVLMFNYGGPGDSTTTTMAQMIENNYYPKELLKNFHLVGLDPRGVGQSHFAQAFAHCANPTDLDTDFFNAAGKCDLSQLNYLPLMNSYTLAKDIDALRDLLDEAQINFMGYSYGARVGLIYADLFPERLRALILDSPITPQFTLAFFSIEQQVGLQKQMDFVQLKLQQQFPEQLFKPLSKQGILAPRILWHEDLWKFKRLASFDYSAELAQNDLEQKEAVAKKLIQLLPITMFQKERFHLTRKDWDALIRITTNLTPEQVTWLIDFQMSQPKTNDQIMDAVLCSDRSADDATIDAAFFFSLCDNISSGTQSDLQKQPIEVPTLIVGNENDPRTPINWYQQMVQLFPKAFRMQVKQSLEHGYLFNQQRLTRSEHHINADALAIGFLLSPNASTIRDPDTDVSMTQSVELKIPYEYLKRMLPVKNPDDLSHAEAEVLIREAQAYVWIQLQEMLANQAQQHLN